VERGCGESHDGDRSDRHDGDADDQVRFSVTPETGCVMRLSMT